MEPFLSLSDTGEREPNGLRILALDMHDATGKIVQTWHVNSGQAYNQELQTDAQRQSGDMSPIPEHVYTLGQLEFAGGKFDWVGSWGEGIGDLWCAVNPVGGTGDTAAVGFHFDDNRATKPGSAACIVFRTRKDAETWVQVMRKYDPDRLYVVWGLGTVHLPKVVATTVQPTASAPKPAQATEWRIYLGPQDSAKLIDRVTVDANGRATVTMQVLAALTGRKLVVNDAERAIRFEDAP